MRDRVERRDKQTALDRGSCLCTRSRAVTEAEMKPGMKEGEPTKGERGDQRGDGGSLELLQLMSIVSTHLIRSPIAHFIWTVIEDDTRYFFCFQAHFQVINV